MAQPKEIYLQDKQGNVIQTTDVFYKRQQEFYDQEGYKQVAKPKAQTDEDTFTIEPVSSDIVVEDPQSVRAQEMDVKAAQQVDENAGKKRK